MAKKIVANRPTQLINLGVTLMAGQKFELPTKLSEVQQKEVDRAKKIGLIKEVKDKPKKKEEPPSKAEEPKPEESEEKKPSLPEEVPRHTKEELDDMDRDQVVKIAKGLEITTKGKIKPTLVKAILKKQEE